MRILGIETSCDETAVCVIETEGDLPAAKIRVLGNELYSQIAVHAKYGGVYPNLAKREHEKNLVPILKKCLEDARLFRKTESALSAEKTEKIREILSHEKELAEEFFAVAARIEKPNIDLIAVTNGPGLEPALWVGIGFAKALGILWGIPVMPINHMEGHILVAMLDAVSKGNLPVAFPALALLVSGGHTELVLAQSPLDYEIVGDTKDDAVGEAFDKVARILGLPYPGGPEISSLAEAERSEFPDKEAPYPLPRPMIASGDFNFSFSGLKTAVLYLTKKIPELSPEIRREIAREFEDAVADVLVAKTKAAALRFGARSLVVGGGVSANRKLRRDFTALAGELGAEIFIPEVSASTDNALMIALAAYFESASGKKPPHDFGAEGNLPVGPRMVSLE